MNDLIIYHHLGLGDHLICLPIVRHYAKQCLNVYVPCKFHNLVAMQFAFRDLANVEVVGVQDDAGAECFIANQPTIKVLRLGGTGENFDGSCFDRSFYRQAGVPFFQRWHGWKVERDKPYEIQVENCPAQYAFVHDDPARGMRINPKLVTLIASQPKPGATHNIFGWWKHIEEATEIHVINSSFLHFIDSIPTQAKRHVLHKYSRPHGEYPSLIKEWEIIT